jgi:hypothetical protein
MLKPLFFLIPLFLFSCTSYKVVKHDNFTFAKADTTEEVKKLENNDIEFDKCDLALADKQENLSHVLGKNQITLCFKRLYLDNRKTTDSLLKSIENSNNANEKNELLLK